jgi:uncharacterized protein YkwD
VLRKPLAAMFVLALLAPVPAAAHTQWPAEKRITYMVRVARHAHGLSFVRHSTRLHRFGRRQVDRMIDCRCVKHAQPPRFCDSWGQVVGIAAGPTSLVSAFLSSPAHRDVLLAPGFHRIGVGARYKGGFLYAAIEVCK